MNAHRANYRLILWDFDGTLADTLPGVLGIFNELALKHGFEPVHDPELAREMTMREFLAAHRVPLAKVPHLVRQIIAAQRRGVARVPLHEGMGELVQKLHASGRRLGIVSSNGEENIRACLRANAVEQCFDFVVGYSRLLGKHHALRRILREESLRPAETLYIGDEARDVLAAQAVGIDVAAVCWGINSARLLARHSPSYLAAAPSDLAELFTPRTASR